MLDLNMDAVSVDSICGESFGPKSLSPIEKLLQVAAGAGAQRDDSGTSNSSVVNADDAPASTGGDADSSSTFNFSMIFNKPKCGVYIDDSAPSTELITRQLFPVNGEEHNNEFASKSSSATPLLRPQWLNLSVPESVPDYELKIFEDQKPPPLPPLTVAQPQVRKSRRGPRSRSSQYRGVTFYRRTGRWESHIWDCGKQVYLGGFDTAHAAARAYDRAAVKFRGVDADINFTISDYEDDLKQMKDLTKEEFVHILRRQSTGFSRGSSKYRGVTLHKCGRWEARMGQLLGKKAYDKAAIECNGREAVTNFEASTYEAEVGVNNNQDGCHNLDLNLWISPPPGGQKGIDTVRSLQLQEAVYGLPNGKRAKVESYVSVPMSEEMPHAVTMSSKHLPTWPTIYSGLAPNYEERAIRKVEAEAVPSLGLSNWAWQINGHGVVTPVPLFSAAASSGFSSTTTPVFSGSFLPLNPQSKKPCFQSPANEISHYYNGKC